MEESSPPVVAKRLWKILKIMLYMIQKGVSKRKLMVELDVHLMMKRGKIAGKKAFGSLMFHHHHIQYPNFSCRTAADVYMPRSSHPIFAPREYEFSCSNSPAFPFLHLPTASGGRRRKHHDSSPYNVNGRHHHHHHHHSNFSCMHPTAAMEDEISVLHRAMEMLDSDTSSSSPVSVLPGFGNGKSPLVRQLRITDSPFPLKESGDENSRVDKEAEEFIQRFYEQLRLQKRVANPCIRT